MTSNDRQKLLLGSLIITVGIAYLVYAGLEGATVYYVTVEEFLAQREGLAGTGLRIAGTVAADSIRRQHAAQEVYFTIQGKTPAVAMPVYYKGTLSDLFRDGATVVLEGRYHQEKNLFHAVTLMTSCPSKYETKLTGQAR